MMGNLQFNGGNIGINMNNQQYLIKDTTFNGCHTGILISHAFDLVVENCQFMNGATGIDGECAIRTILGLAPIIAPAASLALASFVTIALFSLPQLSSL
jgi:hypothetical protein